MNKKKITCASITLVMMGITHPIASPYEVMQKLKQKVIKEKYAQQSTGQRMKQLKNVRVQFENGLKNLEELIAETAKKLQTENKDISQAAFDSLYQRFRETSQQGKKYLLAATAFHFGFDNQIMREIEKVRNELKQLKKLLFSLPGVKNIKVIKVFPGKKGSS